METGVLFIALDMALNCLTATLGMWGGTTINSQWTYQLPLPERGAGVWTRKEIKHEIIETEGTVEIRGRHPGGI